MPGIPVALPRQGMVFARSALMSDSTWWYLVDIQQGVVIQLRVRVDTSTPKQSAVEQVSRHVSESDLLEIAKLTNRIWSSEKMLPTRVVPDIAWDLWLFDSDEVRRDFGPGLPDGLAGEAEQLLQRLVDGR